MIVNTHHLIREIQRLFSDETFVVVEDENGNEMIIEAIKRKQYPNGTQTYCVLKCRKQ